MIPFASGLIKTILLCKFFFIFIWNFSFYLRKNLRELKTFLSEFFRSCQIRLTLNDS